MAYEQIPYPSKPNDDTFIMNPDPRCPCVLILDKSGSMQGRPIAELNQGLRTLREELSADPLASRRVELAVVSFGPVTQDVEFVEVSRFTPPALSAAGDTPMGRAVLTALDMLEARKAVYRQHGIQRYRPWAFLITDGAPTDSIAEAARRVREAEEAKELAFFAIGVDGADFDRLRQLAVREPLRLKGLAFRELFQWLSTSLSSVSRSRPDDSVALPPPKGWAAI